MGKCQLCGKDLPAANGNEPCNRCHHRPSDIKNIQYCLNCDYPLPAGSDKTCRRCLKDN